MEVGGKIHAPAASSPGNNSGPQRIWGWVGSSGGWGWGWGYRKVRNYASAWKVNFIYVVYTCLYSTSKKTHNAYPLQNQILRSCWGQRYECLRETYRTVKWASCSGWGNYIVNSRLTFYTVSIHIYVLSPFDQITKSEALLLFHHYVSFIVSLFRLLSLSPAPSPFWDILL